MVLEYPYEWVDIPQEKVKNVMPNDNDEFVR